MYEVRKTVWNSLRLLICKLLLLDYFSSLKPLNLFLVLFFDITLTFTWNRWLNIFADRPRTGLFIIRFSYNKFFIFKFKSKFKFKLKWNL